MAVTHQPTRYQASGPRRRTAGRAVCGICTRKNNQRIFAKWLDNQFGKHYIQVMDTTAANRPTNRPKEDTMTKNTNPTPAQLIAAEDSGFLTFVDGKLTMKADNDIAVLVKDLDHLQHLMDLLGGGCMCSSLIDFPDDATDDPDTIALCRSLRSC